MSILTIKIISLNSLLTILKIKFRYEIRFCLVLPKFMLTVIIACFVLAAFVPYIFKLSDKNAGVIISLMPFFAFLYYFSFVGDITSGIVVTEQFEWFPSFDVNLDFYLDGLSLVFALVITGIGTAVFLYASEYMKDYKYKDRFYIYILIFMASMLGVVTSDNLIALFIFWELTSVSSFLLIGFNHHKAESRYSANQALLVTGLGGLAMLAGFLMIILQTGSTSISEINTMNSELAAATYYVPILVLVLIGAFTKSAQFPFHFWLPNAMAAPTPVSAYLHSATMVKAGVFLLARLSPALGNTDLWHILVTSFGGVTMLLGAILALFKTDLKKLLAYTTLSVLGTLTMLIGMGSKLAIKAMIIYLVAHSLYKGALFLIAGIIDHETGTRDISKVAGLRKLLPITSIAGGLSALSMMGMFPMLGFLAKEVKYDAALHSYFSPELLIIAAVTAGVFMTVIAIATGIRPFWGKEKYPTTKPHDAPWQMWIGPFLLALIGLALGLFPETLLAGIFQKAVGSVLGYEYNFHLSLWHGFNLVLGLSLLTLALGFTAYYLFSKNLHRLEKVDLFKLLKPSFWYDVVFNGLLLGAKLQTRFLQNGYIRNYISIIILTVITFGALSLFQNRSFSGIEIDFKLDFYEIIIAIVMISATIFSIRSQKRLSSIAGLGIVGAGVAVLFIIYSAPDLALTQFAIEVLTVILFVLVIYKLPKFTIFSSIPNRIRDFAIAISFGLMMTIVVLIAASGEISNDLKNYFSENAYTVAKGKNVVNVILVDFRAMDTLGEITVLGIAAIGVFALLKLRRKESAT